MAIEGIKLGIASDKLKTLLQGRVEYHTTKAKFCKEEAQRLEPAFKDFEDDAEAIGKFSNSNRGGGSNPLEVLFSQGKHHTDKATYFRFIADNLIPNETYILQEHDLQRLEVAK